MGIRRGLPESFAKVGFNLIQLIKRIDIYAHSSKLFHLTQFYGNIELRISKSSITYYLSKYWYPKYFQYLLVCLFIKYYFISLTLSLVKQCKRCLI